MQFVPSWNQQARLHCQSLGDSDLIVVESDEEMTFLQNSTTGSYWIGVSDEAVEGKADNGLYVRLFTLP